MSDRDGAVLGDQARERAGVPGPGLPSVALVVACLYFAGAKIGFALASDTSPLSLLWPPNALLLGALVLLPARQWRWALLGAFPAHMLVQSLEGVPLPMALAWFASNASEALIGALLLGPRGARLANLDSARAVLAFLGAAVVAVVLSSVADAALVRLIGWKEAEFWAMWQSRVPSNILAILIFVPACLAWQEALGPSRQAAPKVGVFVEVAVFEFVLLVLSLVVFDTHLLRPPGAGWPALLYLPLPFLIWAALRYGPLLSSLSFSAVAFVVMWGAKHGRGPFGDPAGLGDAQPTQWFLIALAVPVMLLAAVVAEGRAAQRRLRLTEQISAAAFGSSADAIAIVRRSDDQVVDANDRWRELFPTQERPFGDLVAEGREVRDLELTLADAPEGARRVQLTVKAVGPDHADGIVCTVRDVTALRRAEQLARDQRLQLTHLTRVASLAEFTGSLAHELNQPLTAILSNAQAARRFLEREPPNIDELRTILGEIADDDRRASELIHHLRLLMKKGTEHFEPLDLNTLVRQVLTFARGELVARGVELRTRLSPDPQPVRGDHVQLQQLLLNLVSNACDAMAANVGRRRILTVTTLVSHQGRVHVVVDDSGAGIAPSRREAIFSPYYSSKPNGLGLGLSICRSIVEAHGGTLAAEEHEGPGARMRLVLPGAADA